VVVRVKEKHWKYGWVGVNVSTTSREPTLEANGLLRNLFGNGESLRTSMSSGDSEAGALQVAFSKPKVFGGAMGVAPFGTIDVLGHYSVRSFLYESR
jgi:hypothetical protein